MAFSYSHIDIALCCSYTFGLAFAGSFVGHDLDFQLAFFLLLHLDKPTNIHFPVHSLIYVEEKLLHKSMYTHWAVMTLTITR
jgi:hypothetical protein